MLQGEGAGIAKGQGWRHTSMAGCMRTFLEAFLAPLTAAGRRELAERARESAAQATLAW